MDLLAQYGDDTDLPAPPTNFRPVIVSQSSALAIIPNAAPEIDLFNVCPPSASIFHFPHMFLLKLCRSLLDLLILTQRS